MLYSGIRVTDTLRIIKKKFVPVAEMLLKKFYTALCLIIGLPLLVSSEVVTSAVAKAFEMLEQNLTTKRSIESVITKKKKRAYKPKYCIYVAFDIISEQVITDLRLVLAHEVNGVKSPLGTMRPHITVGIVSTMEKEKLFENFEKLSNRVRHFTVDLNNVNTFNRRKNKVIYLEPLLSEELKETLYHFVDVFPKHEIKSDFKLEQWNPHCTLTKRLTPEAFVQATELAEKCWLPRTVSVSCLGLIDVLKPLDVLMCKSFEHQHTVINSLPIEESVLSSEKFLKTKIDVDIFGMKKTVTNTVISSKEVTQVSYNKSLPSETVDIKQYIKQHTYRSYSDSRKKSKKIKAENTDVAITEDIEISDTIIGQQFQNVDEKQEENSGKVLKDEEKSTT